MSTRMRYFGFILLCFMGLSLTNGSPYRKGGSSGGQLVKEVDVGYGLNERGNDDYPIKDSFDINNDYNIYPNYLDYPDNPDKEINFPVDSGSYGNDYISLVPFDNDFITPDGNHGVSNYGNNYDTTEHVNTYDHEEDISKEHEPGWLGSLWNKVADTSKNIAHGVGDTFKNLKEKVEHKADKTKAVFKDLAHRAKQNIKEAWQNTKETVPQIWGDSKQVLVNFGYQVKDGAAYIKEICGRVKDDVKASETLKKLLIKLEEGNEQVSQFFLTIGKKLSEIPKPKVSPDDVEDWSEGGHTHIPSQPYSNSGYPDLLQDDEEVHNQLLNLVNQGVLEPEDLEILQSHHSYEESNLNLYQQPTKKVIKY